MACRDIKGGTKIIWAESIILSSSLSPSLSLLSLKTLDWLDRWRRFRRPSPGGSFLFCRPRHGLEGRLWWCHVTGPKISSTIGAVCGNNMVAPTKTKIQNGDWWPETPFVKKGIADGVDLGFMSDRSGRKCYGPELNVSVGTRPSMTCCWQSSLCVCRQDKFSALLPWFESVATLYLRFRKF